MKEGKKTWKRERESTRTQSHIWFYLRSSLLFTSLKSGFQPAATCVHSFASIAGQIDSHCIVVVALLPYYSFVSFPVRFVAAVPLHKHLARDYNLLYSFVLSRRAVFKVNNVRLLFVKTALDAEFCPFWQNWTFLFLSTFRMFRSISRNGS